MSSNSNDLRMGAFTPQNWWWIIGVGLFGNVFMTAVGNKVMKNDD